MTGVPRRGGPPHVLEAFDRWVAETPDARAVEAGGRARRYAEVAADASDVASAIRSRGLGPEATVAVLCDRSFTLIAAALGVLRAGCVLVPVDPALTTAQRHAILEDCQPSLVLADPLLAGRELAGLEARTINAATVPRPVSAAAITAANTAALPGPDHLAYVVYSSGTTGIAKGIDVTHAAISNYVEWSALAFGMGPGERVLQLASIGFDVGLWELLWPLTAGGCVVLAQAGRQFDEQYLIRELAQRRVTHLHVTPPLLRLLIREPRLRYCGRLHTVLVSSDTLPAPLLNEAIAALGPRRRIFHLYGVTEVSVESSAWLCRPIEPGQVPPVGDPVSRTSMYVLDEALRPVSDGEAGEIWLSGCALARGYRGRPRRTAEVFVPDPFRGGGTRMYRTGDLARRADGQLVLIGRADRTVKVRGHRLDLGDVEAALTTLPGVDAVSVVVGEGGGLHAYLACSGPEPGYRDVVAHCQRLLPPFAVPGAVSVLGRLPVTVNGKLDRAELAAASRRLLPASSAERAGDELERLVCERLAVVLGLPSVSPADDFLAIGGHSLAALELASVLAAEHSLDLPVAALFAHRTVRGVVASGSVTRRDRSPAGPVPAAGRVPLRPYQTGIWLAQQRDPENTAYNGELLLHVSGQVDAERLRRAVLSVARRHEPLRTRVELGEHGPELVADPVEAAGDGVFTVAPRGTAANSGALPFDLSRDWPVRVRLIPAGTWHVVSLEVHHIAADGGSVGSLLADLAAAYAGSALDEPRHSFTDLTAREVPGEADTAWWTRQLAGFLPLELPADRPRPRSRSGRGAGFDLWIEHDDYAGLLDRAAGLGVTAFALLHAAAAVTFATSAGTGDLVVAVPVDRRPPAARGLVGHFTQTVPLRTRLRPGATLAEVARDVQSAIAEGLAHANVDTAALASALGHGPALRRVEVALQDEPAVTDFGGFPARLEDPPVTSVDLDFQVSYFRPAGPGPLRVRIGYDPDLFDAQTAERLAGQLVHVLRRFATAPQTPWNEPEPVAVLAGPPPAAVPAAPPPAAETLTTPETGMKAIAELVTLVWRDVLGAGQPIGQDGDFFALGGDSLSAVHVALDLRSATGQDVPVSAVFENPRLEAFAAWWAAHRDPLAPDARRAGGPPGPLIPRAGRGGRLPLSRAQQRLWVVDQGSARGHDYELAAGWLLGETSVPAARRAVGELVAAHEILRTGYLADGDGPCQRILPRWRPRPLIFDAQESDATSLARRMLAELRAAAAFDLTSGEPPLAVAVGRSAQGTVLVLNAHHICVDGSAVALLAADLGEILAGRQVQPPQRQYADFAAWEAGRDPDAPGLAAWAAELAGAQAIRLPHGNPARAAPAFLDAAAPAGQVRSLRQAAAAAGGTLFSGLLAAYALALFGATGLTDLVIGTDAANRTVPGTESMVGFFVNQLPLRIRLAAAQGMREVLAESVRVTAAGLRRQEIPFDAIVAAVNPARDGDRTPLIPVKLVLQNVAPAEGADVATLGDIDPHASEKADALLAWEPRAADEGLDGYLEYGGGVTEETARWLLVLVELGLSALASEPDLTVAQFGSRVADLSRSRLRSQRRLRSGSLRETSGQEG